jgi:hypothetical protein
VSNTFSISDDVKTKWKSNIEDQLFKEPKRSFCIFKEVIHEKLEDTKRVIRSLKSKTDRQYGQNKRTNNTNSTLFDFNEI